MKKLMMAVGAIALAVSVQASTYNWNVGTATGGELYKAKSETLITGKTMYMFAAADVSWDLSELLGDLRDGGSLSDYTGDAVYSQTVTDGKWTYTKGAFTTESSTKSQEFFLVLQDGDNYFLNNETLSGLTTSAGKDFKYDYSWSGAADSYFGTDDYDIGGWYSAAAVPEPFSGSLAVLGMGLLALRRKMKKAKKA